jgi:hypothetical protein
MIRTVRVLLMIGGVLLAVGMVGGTVSACFYHIFKRGLANLAKGRSPSRYLLSMIHHRASACRGDVSEMEFLRHQMRRSAAGAIFCAVCSIAGALLWVGSTAAIESEGITLDTIFPGFSLRLLGGVILAATTAWLAALCGFLLARRKNRNEVLWGIMCFLLQPAIIVLLILPNKPSSQNEVRGTPN